MGLCVDGAVLWEGVVRLCRRKMCCLACVCEAVLLDCRDGSVLSGGCAAEAMLARLNSVAVSLVCHG